MINITRNDESKLTSWFFEIDRRLFGAVLILIFLGIICAVSAGSVSAERPPNPKPWNYFVLKGIPFYVMGTVALFVTSILNKKWVMRLSFLDVVGGLGLLALTVAMPQVINGSKRWVDIFGFNIMPADIMKPGFIFVTAWFLAKMREKHGDDIFFKKSVWRLDWWSWWSYMAVFVPTLIIIYLHPDIGTALLYFLVFCAMLFLAGLPLSLIPVGVAFVVGMLTIAFFTTSHVHDRIIAWRTGTGDRYQIDNSLASIRHGGLFGSGEEAYVKQELPDAHTDFIFAAVVEDLGSVIGCVLLAFLGYVLLRLAHNAERARDQFVFYAAGGTMALFGAQICFNMLSTLDLFAPKGMTLPFISYGGSSLLGFCILFGMLIAVLREDKWK